MCMHAHGCACVRACGFGCIQVREGVQVLVNGCMRACNRMRMLVNLHACMHVRGCVGMLVLMWVYAW